MVMIPTEIMGHLSILLLNRLASREDQGQPCLAMTPARTIEEVARALLQPEGETITLPRKKGNVP